MITATVNIETGGPALPVVGSVGSIHSSGMTLRDYFAAKALPAIQQNGYGDRTTARMAYDIADSMLEARK